MISSIKITFLTTTNQDSAYNYSCIHQLIVITHNIFTAFDAKTSLNVREVFPDLSEAFDRVLRDGLLHKPKSNGIDSNLCKHI